MLKVTCPYCQSAAALVTGATVYPHRPDLAEKHIYTCTPCKAWVGCHPGTTTPLGRLANASLRAAKQRAHAAFDPLWRDRTRGERKKGARSRSKMYGWLADQLGIAHEDCHIGMFDEAMCARVVEVCAGRAGGGDA